MRILVVEDDDKIASFITNGLKQNGFSVDCAPDGEVALSLCATVTYDALILDIMLPRLDGLSVLSRIRQNKRLVPVLLLSARASVESRVDGLRFMRVG
jgi:two-component system OmpR family response regulator